MIFIVLSVLVIASILAIICDHISLRKSKLLYVFLGLFLILIAGLRDGENMPDYSMYNDLYNQIVNENYSYLIEITFIVIVRLSNQLIEGNSIFFFVIYAILGVSLKLFTIKKLSNFCFYSLVIYISNYYILHEMIQIRVGIASAFILLSIVPLYNRDFKSFIALIGCAFLFHYSSFIFILLWFLKPDKFNKKLYFSLIPIAYIVSFKGIDTLSYIGNVLPIDFVLLKLDTYTNKTRADNYTINVFGIFILTRIAILFYFSSFANKIKQYNKYFFIELKIYAIGVFIYIAFSIYPEIAVRISYTLMASEIIIIPTLIYTIRGYYFPRVILVSYALLAFVLNVFFTTYFNYLP